MPCFRAGDVQSPAAAARAAPTGRAPASERADSAKLRRVGARSKAGRGCSGATTTLSVSRGNPRGGQGPTRPRGAFRRRRWDRRCDQPPKTRDDLPAAEETAMCARVSVGAIERQCQEVHREHPGVTREAHANAHTILVVSVQLDAAAILVARTHPAGWVWAGGGIPVALVADLRCRHFFMRLFLHLFFPAAIYGPKVYKPNENWTPGRKPCPVSNSDLCRTKANLYGLGKAFCRRVRLAPRRLVLEAKMLA